MEQSRKADEERALALAGLALMKAALEGVERKGLLSPDETDGVFERALASLEFRSQDGATGLARRIVEGAAIGHAAGRPGVGEGSGGSS